MRCLSCVVALVWTLLFEATATHSTCNIDSSPTYRAAVVEFEPSTQAESAQENLLRNVHRATEFIEEAGRLNVDIIVFPEYGLSLYGTARDVASNASQDIPNPKSADWNPCLEPQKFPNDRNEILHILSCASRNNSVVVVANLLGRELCSVSIDPNCPADGQYIYNTNVVFDKNGTLVARYRKFHLYYEDMLDKPHEPEYSIIDLGFAKFGVFICWDIFFEEPSVELVNKYGIRNLIFSTAWGSELPFITSTQNFAQFAHGVEANLLVSNLYYEEGSVVLHLGSGIYSSSKGALNETLDLATSNKMIIADVPVNPPITSEESTTCVAVTSSDVTVVTKPESCLNPALNWSGTDFVLTNLPSSDRTRNKTLKVWMTDHLTNFSFTELTGEQGHFEVCQEKLCCSVTYEFENRDPNDTYVLGVRNGCRRLDKDILGLQICSVLRCKSGDAIEKCGLIQDTQPTSRFKELLISGIFETKHIYPNVFATTFANVPRDVWKFRKQLCQDGVTTTYKAKGTLEAMTSFDQHPILVASLYARVYEWDK